MFGDYFASGRLSGSGPVDDLPRLRHFLDSRASHVAQASLYGYIRTRAGTRYPELFENDPFIASMNIAKWQIWAACLSDLSVYAGGLVFASGTASADRVRELIDLAVDGITSRVGTPADAGPAFGAAMERLRRRIRGSNWAVVDDGEEPFSESPQALVCWAPIIDELKKLDDEIVRNSVRFRWIEVRDDLRDRLRPAALVASLETERRSATRVSGG